MNDNQEPDAEDNLQAAERDFLRKLPRFLRSILDGSLVRVSCGHYLLADDGASIVISKALARALLEQLISK